MAPLLRTRIRCFYCGSKSQHTKAEKLKSFQCSTCEGTNYLDQDGNITDVPADVIDRHDASPRRYATARLGSASPPGRSSFGEDSIFCQQCLKNQRFLADCLANYLPSESDPRYEQFEDGYPAYKKSLELRYPPVCVRCEPRVRARLKQTSYAAKTDILAKSLTRGHSAWSGEPHESLWRALAVPGLLIAEAVWLLSLLMEVAWHVIALRDSLRPHNLTNMGEAVSEGPASLAGCLSRATSGTPLGHICHAHLSHLTRMSLVVNLFMLWWNPALLRLHGRRTINTLAFYQFAALSFILRFGLWSFLRRTTPDAAVIANRAHVLGILAVVITAALAYTVVRAAPRQKIQFRSLDSPLIDKDSVQYPQADTAGDQTPRAPITPPRFSIGRLSHDQNPFTDTPFTAQTAKTSLTSQFTPTPGRYRDQHDATDTASEDAMDWEPVQNQSYNLRPRARDTTPTPAPLFPITSAFMTQPIGNGPSPFHGSLPPAPRSMEAKLRTAAQQQPAKFKPAPDAKQADWFKRMRLSQASWASKDYVSSVADPDKRVLELRDPKLDLHSLGIGGGRRDGGTGLEDIFGTTFRLDDETPVMDQVTTSPNRQDSRKWSLILMASTPLWVLCMVYLLQTDTDAGLAVSLQSLWTRTKALGYGQ